MDFDKMFDFYIIHLHLLRGASEGNERGREKERRGREREREREREKEEFRQILRGKTIFNEHPVPQL